MKLRTAKKIIAAVGTERQIRYSEDQIRRAGRQIRPNRICQARANVLGRSDEIAGRQRTG